MRLVSELIRLNTATDPDVATVAAQCLSEIGPVNLNVLSLRGGDGSQIFLFCYTRIKTRDIFCVIEFWEIGITQLALYYCAIDRLKTFSVASLL